MERFFEKIDPTKILSYGIIGLGLLLAVLTFWLLQKKQVGTRATVCFMIFAVVVMSFGLASEIFRQRLTASGITKSWFQMADAPRPCYAQADWPNAKWFLWGRFDNHTPTEENTDNFKRIPQVFPWAVFTSGSEFYSETEEMAESADAPSDPTSRRYLSKAEDGKTLAPGSTLTFIGQDNIPGGLDRTRYKMIETLTVSPDGCMITGHWEDNRHNKGDEHYLYPSDRYYVSMASSQH